MTCLNFLIIRQIFDNIYSNKNLQYSNNITLYNAFINITNINLFENIDLK